MLRSRLPCLARTAIGPMAPRSPKVFRMDGLALRRSHRPLRLSYGSKANVVSCPMGHRLPLVRATICQVQNLVPWHTQTLVHGPNRSFGLCQPLILHHIEVLETRPLRQPWGMNTVAGTTRQSGTTKTTTPREKKNLPGSVRVIIRTRYPKIPWGTLQV